jgi:hypothetical protein
MKDKKEERSPANTSPIAPIFSIISDFSVWHNLTSNSKMRKSFLPHQASATPLQNE